MSDVRRRERVGRRTVLRRVIAGLAAVPVATGLLAIARGPAGAPGGEPTTASVDSEYRFVNTFWVAAGLGLWWSLCQPEKRAGTTRALLGIAAAGGIPRLLSWRATGAPHPVFRATLVLELIVVPLVIRKHRELYPRR